MTYSASNSTSRTDLLLPGIRARRIPTARLTVNMLDDGRPEGEPVVLLHGSVSSALFVP